MNIPYAGSEPGVFERRRAGYGCGQGDGETRSLRFLYFLLSCFSPDPHLRCPGNAQKRREGAFLPGE